MNVEPFVITLGPLEVTGFGLMMMVAFVTAGWVAQLELRRRGFNDDYGTDMLVAALVGGIVGAKLWYAVLTRDPGNLLSRGGFVWYGGFLGGALGVTLNSLRRGVPVRWTAQLVAPALAAGYALGRVGCFLVQDDYGGPTDLPWGMRFPNGAPPSTAANLREFGVAVPADVAPSTVLAVHPTQLYETAIMLAAFAVLWRYRAARRPVGWLFGLYLVFAGVERFLIEILRAKDDRFLGPFTVAQFTSVLIVAIGMVVLQLWKGSPDPAPGAYLGGGGSATVTRKATVS